MGETTTSQAASPGPLSTAGRLKYADPRDLPSFPSSGLRPDGAAASAAASLGWANQKPVELWKPDKTSSASAAAVLAKDYKMAPGWEPGYDSAGHKAALLAVGSAGAALRQASPKSQHDNWGNSAASQAFAANRLVTVPVQQQPASTHGSSAATHAFNYSRPAPSQQVSSNDSASAATQAFNVSRSQSIRKPTSPAPADDSRSLAAAKGAMRPRAVSTPSTGRTRARTLEAGAASSAVNGAALAHRASLIAKTPSPSGGSVPVTTMTRNMFTANPPVRPETDEQANNERLHQSAVEMAKKMYTLQKKAEAAKERGDGTEADGSQGTYLNLQDAAYKQAQERLAKLHDEHQQSRDYQAYYGSTPTHRRRFSVVNKLHRRSSSDSDLVNDRQRSETIRQQMSMFSNKLSEVDKNKRDKDREALLAVAQRNVKARLQGMDEKMYRETGKANSSMVGDWELKAQQAAQIRHESRTENKGKIDIGGGRFMDPDEIDAIAARRVQPVLDDINERAENERERQMVLKLEEEARKAELERERTHERELRDDKKKARDLEKQEERAKKEQEKQEEKAKRDEEKAHKAEEKRIAKEEKRKSKQSAGLEPIEHIDTTRDEDNDTSDTTPSPIRPTIETDVAATGAEQTKSPNGSESATSPTSKVKGWLKNRFSRGKSVSDGDSKRKSFLGGKALRKSEAGDEDRPSLDNRQSSMREVALAGRDEEAQDSRGVSPVSTDSDEIEEAPTGRGISMLPPRPLEDPVARTSSSPTRDSRFKEMMDR